MTALEFLTQVDPELATSGNKVVAEMADLMENYAAIQNKEQTVYLRKLEVLVEKLTEAMGLEDPSREN